MVRLAAGFLAVVLRAVVFLPAFLDVEVLRLAVVCRLVVVLRAEVLRAVLLRAVVVLVAMVPVS